jgi:hypothetical protein
MRIVTGLLIVAVAVAFAVGGLVLVQRLYSTERRKLHNDMAGFIYTVLGVSSRVASCDTAYRTKYHRYADNCATHMVHPEARATTIKPLSR